MTTKRDQKRLKQVSVGTKGLEGGDGIQWGHLLGSLFRARPNLRIPNGVTSSPMSDTFLSYQNHPTRMAASEHKPIHPGADIGHVHLKVADLDRALGFYRDILGFVVMQRIGDLVAFLSAGGYHHHIGLNTWESLGGDPPPRGTTGLYHTAIRYPTRAALAEAVYRVLTAQWSLDGAADHGVSEAIYLRDPDENGVELYWDRPSEGWPRDADGTLSMYTRRLDLNALLAERNPS